MASAITNNPLNIIKNVVNNIVKLFKKHFLYSFLHNKIIVKKIKLSYDSSISYLYSYGKTNTIIDIWDGYIIA